MQEEPYRQPWYISEFLKALKTSPNRMKLWVFLGREILSVYEPTHKELVDYLQIPKEEQSAFLEEMSKE